jgi:acyl carrier protein
VSSLQQQIHDAAFEMEKLNMQDLLGRVQKVFNSTFEVDPEKVTLHTLPGDITGWDSMGHVTLANNLEQEFNVNLDVDELMEMENVREIIRILAAKLSPK